MFAPKWACRPNKLARFPSWDPLHHWVLSVAFKCFATIRFLSYVSCPERSYTFVFCFQTVGSQRYFYQRCNYQLILANITILILSFQTLEFHPCFYKHSNSDLILRNVRRFQTSFYNVYCPHFFVHCLLRVSLLGFLSLYSADPFQASFMVLSAPNLVFVGCVAFSLVFFCIFSPYISFIEYVIPPLFRPFLIVCYFFSPCGQHIILVFYFTYTFHLYFAVHVFSESMLFRISCSLLLFNPDLLLITFSYLQLVALQKIFISIFFLFVFVLEKEHVSFLSSILEFCCYFYKHRNSGPIFIYIGILMLSFQTLEFWSYFYTCRFSDLLLQRGEILALFLYPSVFFPIFSFQTVEFWPHL